MSDIPRSGPEPDASPPGPARILLWTAWFGLLAGTLELAIFLLKCHYLDPRNYNASRHLAWMHPVAGLAVLGGPGSLLALAARIRPGRIPPSIVLGLLSSVAYVGILFRLPIYTAVCLLLAAGLGHRTGRFLAARAAGGRPVAGRGLVAMSALLAATVLASYGREAWPRPRAPARPPGTPRAAKNAILIVLDTVRARSLGLHGYPRDTTPNLSRLGAGGVRFDRAFSTAPWTAPSHASMFTGRWCRELSVNWGRPLDRQFPTLAEYLGDRGYATAGFVANATYCSYETGLARGFDHYEDYDVTPRSILFCSALVQRAANFVLNRPRLARWAGQSASSGGGRKDAGRINRDFLAWLDRHRDRPFFTFLNYFDAHHPYFEPEPEGGPTIGQRPGTLDESETLRRWWDLDKRRIGPRDVELARDAYDRCIASLDRQIGLLFRELERRGVLDETLVVITADHGEHLGEHRLFGHGCSLYLPELHVPLLVIAPGSVPVGRTVNEPVSLRDIPATVLDQLGFGGASPFPGRSLAMTWSGREGMPSGPAGPVVSEIHAPPEADPNRGNSPACRGPMISLIDRDFHYIRNGQGREELYATGSDPGEVVNLAATPGAAPLLKRFREALR